MDENGIKDDGGNVRGGRREGGCGHTAFREVLVQRGREMARRLLAGAGRVSVMIPSRPELFGIETLGHRWSARHGQLLVAVLVPDEVEPPADDEPLEARFRIDKAAVLPEVSILASSLQGLSELHFLVDHEVAALTPAELGPLSEAVDSPGVRLCRMSTDRMLIHVGGRVESLGEYGAKLRPTFPSVTEELTVADLVLAHGEDALRALAEAVLDDRWPGESMRICDAHVPCEHLNDRVFLVDVASTCLTLLSTTGGTNHLITVDLAEPVHEVAELERALLQMFQPSSQSSTPKV